MTKQNLGRSTTSKRVKPVDTRVEMMKQIVSGNENVPFIFRCNKCGKQVMDNDKDFMLSFSRLNAGNRCRLPVCRECIDSLYEEYYSELENENEAARRVCMKYDIYYCDELAEAMKSGSKPLKRMSYYIAKSQSSKYANKTYDTTVLEEKIRAKETEKIPLPDDIDPETVMFWGSGFSSKDYEYLDSRYSEWILSYPVQAKAMEAIIQKICLLELQIMRGIQKGEKVDSLCKAMNDMMNAAGIQPKQNSDNAVSDTASFGTLIKRWEDEDPVPEPQEKWKDIDGIRRYISVFFFGHLSKMFGFKNNWSALYEEEIGKYTVDRPELADSDINQISYEDIFGTDNDI